MLNRKNTYAFINAMPNPVGVNQEVLFHVGITDYLMTAADGWQGLWVEIIRPDNTAESIRNIRTDSTGGTGVVYTPTMTGTHRVRTHFLEQTYRNVTYLESVSEWLELVVQSERAPYYPGFSLPSEYWTRPIDAQIREWYTISGSWLSASIRNPQVLNDNDYSPESPHILWTKPYTIGGLAGGEITGIHSFEMGDAYEGKWTSRIILAGKLYYTLGPYERPAWTYCVDVHTGETLWVRTLLDNRSISFGQLYFWDSYNMHGVFEYLWVTVGSNWYGFDAFTGDHKTTLYNVPSGTRVEGTKGEFYIYSVSLTARTMTVWNQSAFVSMEGSWGSQLENREYNVTTGEYRTRNNDGTWGAWVTTGAADRIARARKNYTIPTRLPGSVRTVELGNKVFGALINQTHVITWGFSLKPGEEGRLLFQKTWNAPSEWLTGNLTVLFITASFKDRAAIIWTKEKRENYAFSTDTGDYMWGPSEPEHYMNSYTRSVELPLIYNGKMYATGASGIVYCYDIKTGKRLWTYEAKDPYAASEMWQREGGGTNWWLMLIHRRRQSLPRLH